MIVTWQPELVHELAAEVIRLCDEDRFLAGGCTSNNLSFQHEDGQVAFDIRQVSDWFMCTDAHNDDTQFVKLNDLLIDVKKSRVALHILGPRKLEHELLGYHEAIRQKVVSSKNVRVLGSKLFDINHRGMDIDEVIGHVHLTIISQLSAIVDARALTLSRRYVLGEAMFAAYQNGIMPFGWDWDSESLWCLDPATI